VSIKNQWAIKMRDISEGLDVVEWANGDLTVDFQGQLLSLVNFAYSETENMEFYNVHVDRRETKVWVGRERTQPEGSWVAVHTQEGLRTEAVDPVAAVVKWYFERAMASDD
jgi:hypothetical protein